MSGDTPVATNRTASPYKGLDHYEEEDAPFFFGREVQRDLIVANLIAARLTLLYGESGVGKTSLLNAGVVPRLRDEPDVAVVVFRSWDDDPIAGLIDAIRATSGVHPSAGASGLSATIAASTERLGRDLVIILDQFEEYFVYHSQEDGEGTFAVEFPRAVNQRELRVSFLISIREDAIARIDRFKGRIPNPFGNYLRVDRLDRTAAREAIKRPLEEFERRQTRTAHLGIEPDLVEAVLNQVRAGIIRLGQTGVGVIDSAGTQEWQIEAPYLQLVMTRLWDEENAAHSRTLRLQTLDRLGGAEQIIHMHLDAAMAELTDAQRDLAVRVFRFLVTPSGTKIAYRASDLADYAEATAEEVGHLLDRLAGQQLRILRGVSDGKYEIYHDVLAMRILDWRTRFLQGPRGDIAHVVVLMLQSRSFDHMLGFLQHPDSGFDGLLRVGPFNNSGSASSTRAPATPDAKVVFPVSFVRSNERKERGIDRPRFGRLLGPLVKRVRTSKSRKASEVTVYVRLATACQPPAQVPVLSRLALEFAVCTRWFSSVPGGTWPNRNFAHAATSDGETGVEIRPYTNRTIFEVLEDYGADWRIYHDDVSQAWTFPALWDTPERHAKWFTLTRFAEHVASGALPEYTFIEPNYRPPLHTLDQEPVVGAPDLSNSQHPGNNLVSDAAYDTFTPAGETDFTRAERLIASVYEALRGNPAVFARTILLITYDEHGGLYDHRPPPSGIPAPGGARGVPGRMLHAIWHRKMRSFDFTTLGPRVPAVIVSPRIAQATVDHRERDHASIPATLRALFAPSAPPLTPRDAWSAPFFDLLRLPKARTDLPDLSAYLRPPPAAATTPPVLAAAGATSAPAEHRVPPHYQSFVALADQVRRRLAASGEPEISVTRAADAMERSAQTSRAFEQAAHRHRHSTNEYFRRDRPARAVP
jgi:phospholipase C